MGTIILFALLYLAMAFLAAWSDLITIAPKKGRVRNFRWYVVYYFSSMIFWPLHITSALYAERGRIHGIFRQERIGWWSYLVFSVILSIGTGWLLVKPSISVVLFAPLLFVGFFVVFVIWLALIVILLSVIHEKTSDRIVDYFFHGSKIKTSIS